MLALLLLLLPAFADIPPAPPTSAASAAASGGARLFPTTEATTAAGLKVSVDLRDEYLAGFPVFVTITVRNPTGTPQSFADLSARPFLAHFLLGSSKGYKQDRFNTPPAEDSGESWTIPPNGQRQVLLELPSSTTLATGNWTLSLELRDPAGTVGFPTRNIRIVTPAPVAGEFSNDPAVASTSGSALAWLHQAASGFDLYLSTFEARKPGKMLGPFALAHLDQRVNPHLSRTRPTDANIRYVYWQADPASITLFRLDGYTARSQPRSVALPYPKVELLADGVTDRLGGFQLPIWVPAPSGLSGSVKVLGLDEKGKMVLRIVADLPKKPMVTSTALDGAGNLLFALASEAGVDLYRVDPASAAELPARGMRVWKAEGGFSGAALAWDVLPDKPDRPGGLALQILLKGGTEEARSYRRIHTDLNGKILVDSGVHPWPVPGGFISSFLSAGPEVFYVVSTGLPPRNALPTWYYWPQGGVVQPISSATGGELWQDAEGVHWRRVGGPKIVEDRLLGPNEAPLPQPTTP